MKATILIAMILVTSFAEARERAGVRNQLQRQRIQQGVESGELNRAEARRLRAGQRHVHRVEKRAAADGELSAEEKARIEKAQDRQSRRIHRQDRKSVV